jgi:hypothetical protein
VWTKTTWDGEREGGQLGHESLLNRMKRRRFSTRISGVLSTQPHSFSDSTPSAQTAASNSPRWFLLTYSGLVALHFLTSSHLESADSFGLDSHFAWQL